MTDRLPPHRVDRALTLSMIEGAFYALMVGAGEAYFVADAVRLGASPMQLGLLVGLPLAIGGAGAALALVLLQRVRRRRPYVVLGVLLQCALLGAMAAGDATDRLAPWTLIAAICVYQVCGQFSGALWSSWYGDLVPVETRGRYFSKRNRVVHLTTLLSIIAGGLVLQRVEPGGRVVSAVAASGGMGFAAVFAVAAAARLCCAALLWHSPEPPFRRMRGPRAAWRRIGAARASLAGAAAQPFVLKILGAAALVNLAVYTGSTFFTPYMLTDLGLDYRSFMAASAMQAGCKVLFVQRWGAAVDRHGPIAVYRIAALFVALIPLPWLFIDQLGGLVAVLVVQGFSGFAWSAHEIALFTLLLQSSERRERPHVFALQSLMNGSAQFAGAAVGALVLSIWTVPILQVFALSLLLRLCVAGIVPFLLRGVREPAPGRPRRRLLLRVIGLRPSGGMVHRPVPEPASEAGDRPLVVEGRASGADGEPVDSVAGSRD